MSEEPAARSALALQAQSAARARANTTWAGHSRAAQGDLVETVHTLRAVMTVKR